MSIHPKVPIQTEQEAPAEPGGSCLIRLSGGSDLAPPPGPPGGTPRGWRGCPEGFHIKPTAGKSLGNGVSQPGFLCTHPSRVPASPASSCQKPLLSPPVASHPLLLTGSHFIPVNPSLSLPCCLCHLSRLPQEPGGALHCTLPPPPTPCRRPQASPFPFTQCDSPRAEEPCPFP